VIINTRWNVVAKEGLVIPILSLYTQQDAFTQSKDDLLAGQQGFRGGKIFLFSVKFRPAVISIQRPIQWKPETIYLCVKQPEDEAEHSPPSTEELKSGSYLHSPIYEYLYGILFN
jgi:hypothetical protein